METFITILQILSVFLCCNCQSVDNLKTKRKWLEIDNNLYRIEIDNKYTWQQAVAECRNESTNLLTLKSDYDYVKLKDTFKREIENDSNFWINTKVKTQQQACAKIDSTTFVPQPHDCQDRLGFICQRSFLKEFSTFNNGKNIYLVQPDQKFTCQQAFSECQQHEMNLLHFNNYTNNTSLKNYIFLNYNSNISFHLNGTNNNCVSLPHGEKKLELGFICEKLYLRNTGLTMRHWILIIFVSSLACLVIIVKIIQKCVCVRYVHHYNVRKV